MQRAFTPSCPNVIFSPCIDDPHLLTPSQTFLEPRTGVYRTTNQYVLPDAAYPPSLIVSDNNYLLPAINQNEPQYASRDAAYPP